MQAVKAAAMLPSLAPALGTGAVIVIMTVIVVRAFGGPDALAGVLICAAALLVLAGYRNIPLRLRHTAALLLGVTVLLLPFATSPIQAIQRGIFVSGQLLAMIASVMLLAQCALRSPRVQAIGAALRAQPDQRRYVSFTMVSQLFSGMLGMAGAHLMLIMAAPAEEANSPKKTAAVIAVTRGFSCAGFWSPVFGNMVILLALYPTVKWVEVFPIGLVLSQLTVIAGLLTNRFGTMRATTAPAAPHSIAQQSLLQSGLPLLAVLLGFMGTILITSQLLHIGITPTLVLIVPLTALAAHLVISEPGRRIAQTVESLRASAQLYPRLSSEAIIFVAAGCAGSIMADAFPIQWAQHIGETLKDAPFLAIAFLMASVMGLGLAGIHPVLTTVFLVSSVTPQVLALPPIVHLGALLVGWGLSAALTPFSVLSLAASRYAGTTLYQISLGKNWAFALVSALLSCTVLALIASTMR